MVYVNDKKYACETCIKGHRSSACKHTDRPLYEIKRKGRPVTQCEHCRELRKTKQVHVKCICSSKDKKDKGEGSSSSGKVAGTAKVPASAAFPSGLPEALEASVAFHHGSDGSDSDHSATCNCADGVTCECCTPRVSRGQRLGQGSHRRGSHGSMDLKKFPSAEVEMPVSQPGGLVATAHTGNHRPVLPRPSEPAPIRTPPYPSPSTQKASTARHQAHHGQMFYSPYGRAYEFTRTTDFPPEAPSSQQAFQQQMPNSSAYPEQPSPVPDSLPPWIPSLSVSSPNGSFLPTSFCGCGPSCACPGCAVHRGADADPTAACTNSETCLSCIECALLAPTSASSESSQGSGIPISPPADESIDDWLRQVALLAPNLPPAQQQLVEMRDSPMPPADEAMPYDPQLLQTYALWNDVQLQAQVPRLAPGECCGGRCGCPPERCVCTADCTDGCAGHREAGVVMGKTLTFAVSGERGSIGRGAGHQVFGGGLSASAMMDSWADGASLTVPRAPPSRASSMSSHASSHASHTSTPNSLADTSAGQGTNMVPMQSGDIHALRSSLRMMMNSDSGLEQDMFDHRTSPYGDGADYSMGESNPDPRMF